MNRIRLVVAVAATALVAVSPAWSHNAGHVFTGDGSCLNVGSFKDGPVVPEQNPNRNTIPGDDFGRLDLIPGPGDQYGARYAADQGNAAPNGVWPAGCP
jgi:hypothetical protein